MGRTEGGCTLNVGIIQGGTATNVVPEECTVRGEVRSFSHEQALALAEQVKKQFEASAASLGATSQFTLKTGCRAYRTPPEHPW
jgi:tripeptide aminopeptidase